MTLKELVAILSENLDVDGDAPVMLAVDPWNPTGARIQEVSFLMEGDSDKVQSVWIGGGHRVKVYGFDPYAGGCVFADEGVTVEPSAGFCRG